MSKQIVLKFYTDKKYLTGEEYEPILFPFWGVCVAGANSLLESNFKDYLKNGKIYFQLTTIEDCDFILWPEKYNENGIHNSELLRLSESFKKPNIIFFQDDSDKKINVKNSYIFRTSINLSSREKNEFSMPTWSGDFSEKYCKNVVPLKEKRTKPIVGYCGYTKNFKDRFKKILRVNYGEWRDLRFEIVKKLKKNKKIISNFIIRKDFWGGAYNVSGKNALFKKSLSKVREEYANNLIESDYALVVRGRGNYSIRFYEAISLGRICLFVDTDCVLPYDKYVNWRDLCVWVENSETESVDCRLVEFHSKISAEDFVALQKKIREVYKEWISPDGFFKNFYKHFS